MSGKVTDNLGRSSGLIKAVTAEGGGTSWQAVTTGTTLTAVAGRGYPINTTSNICTVTLPGSASVGDTIVFVDYARTWGTNAVTINPNSLNFQGASSPNPKLFTSGQSVSITYVDATKGWIPTTDDDVIYPQLAPYTIEFLVIGGGGGGASGLATPYRRSGGGGGAGGYRVKHASDTTGGGGTESNTNLTDISSGIVLTIDVGGGGAGAAGDGNAGTVGQESSIKGTGVDITSAGGGAGGRDTYAGGAGGSGGGAGAINGSSAGGAGTSNQGFAGGGGSGNKSGGGGGAAEAGSTDSDGEGGDGVASTITAASVSRGGGGGGYDGGVKAGGTGGGGASGSSNTNDSVAGTANTGGGGGGAASNEGANPTGSAGGSGVVILRIPDADYSGTTSGSPTVDTSSVADETILIFNADGSYTT